MIEVTNDIFDADTEEEVGIEVEDFEVSAGELDAIGKKKRHYVVQHDEMDCGAACLAMVAKFYGKKIDLATFRSLLNVTREGTSLFAIQKGAEFVGFEAIGIQTSADELIGLRVPMIALMQYHFVVIFEITKEFVEIGDPAVGSVRFDIQKFKKEFSKYCLLLKKTSKLDAFPESLSSYRKYLKLFHGHHTGWFHVVSSSFLMFLVGLLVPFIGQVGLDSIVGGSTQYLKIFSFILLASLFYQTLLSWLRTYVTMHFTAVLDAKLMSAFLKQLYALPLSYFAVRKAGDFLARLGELKRIQAFLTHEPLSLLLNLVSIAIYSVVLGIYSPNILLSVLGFVLLMGSVIVWSTSRLTQIMNQNFQLSVRISSILFEHFRSLETLWTINAFIPCRWKFQSVVLESQKYALKNAKFGANLSLFSSIFQALFSLVVFVLAIDLYIKAELTIGQVLAVNTLAAQVATPAFALIHQWQGLQAIALSIARVDDLMTAAPEILTPRKGKKPFELKGGIVFENVQFRYGSELSPLVLDNVSFRIEPGETVAIVGKSGSGKTTLGYMVNLLYSPTHGRILFDGVPHFEIPLSVIRKQVATVLQDGKLLSEPIVDNIGIGHLNPDFQRVLRASKAADAHGFISELKDGYLSRIGEDGVNLSGGQTQRISIARALYSDPRILIMDEATASLDAVSESYILKNNVYCRQGRTTIIIAHRFNTFMNADKIVVLDHGRVSEIGTHRDLILRRGPYYDLFRLQMRIA